MFTFEEIDIKDINEEEYYGFEEKVLFTTKQWIRYIKTNQNATPVIIRITKENKFVGYFTCLLFKKFGIKIIGSPFNGWTTGYMGFDVVSKYSKVDIIKPLSEFLFKEYKCLYIQIADRFIQEDEVEKNGFEYVMSKSIELRIDKTDEGLFKVFKTDCRNYIRQFERRGAAIEIAEPNEEFANQYYEQLKEVFAKQGLVPTYSIKKVTDLFNSMNAENLLCLRVKNPEGQCIATSIFVGYNERFYFWGAASFRKFQFYRPNEYMIWTAIKYFRDRGYKYFDMYGERPYKNKFGPESITYPCIMIAKFPMLIKLRELAKKVVWLLFKIKGMNKKKSVGKTQKFNKENK